MIQFTKEIKLAHRMTYAIQTKSVSVPVTVKDDNHLKESRV